MALSKDFGVRYKNDIQKSLKYTVTALNYLANCILEAETNDISVIISTIRTLTTVARHKAQQTTEYSKEFLKETEQTTEQLILKQKTISDDLKEIKTKLQNQNTHLKYNSEMITKSQDSLRNAEKQLEDAKQSLSTAESSCNHNKGVRDAGIGMTVLLALPIIGLIPGITGAVMWGVGQKALDNARIVAREAQQAVDDVRGRVKHYDSERSGFLKEKDKTEKSIKELERQQQLTEEDLSNMKEKHKLLADIQEKFQQCTHFLSILEGRVSVLNVHTKNIICWEVVIQNMEEVAKQLFQLIGNNASERYQLLYQPEIMNVIEELKSTNVRVNAILGKNKYAISDFI